MAHFDYVKEAFGSPIAEIRPDDLVADVGGRCFGHDTEERLIFDHHFDRQGNFPSAAAAVLVHAPAILERLGQRDAVTLVTHQEPDFDALCSVFLARRVLEEGEADELERFSAAFAGVESNERSAWWKRPLEPRFWSVPPSVRLRAWVLLAAYASHADQCWPIHCSRAKALHSVLYSAMHVRRRSLPDDAYSFFRDAEEAIIAGELNPLTDAVFGESSKYGLELAALEREAEFYRRDLGRARRAIVNVPAMRFEAWSEAAKKTPLLLADGGVNPVHLCEGQPLKTFDGLYLRDPECLLFKEWARADAESSSSGSGFAFLAIAYSGSGGGSNGSRYIVSLDPERCGDAHLYPVWAKLQAAEIAARGGVASCSEEPRKHFEDRLRNTPGCGDPWFDGSNYHCTIVDTPRAGTALGAGTKRDLSDDSVAAIVQRSVEWGIFEGDVKATDFPVSKTAIRESKACRVEDLADLPPPHDSLRVAEVVIKAEAKLSFPSQREAIGRLLWRAIEEAPLVTTPPDFLDRHLVGIGDHTIVVWNRRGLAVARKANEPQADVFAAELRHDVEILADVLSELRSLAGFEIPDKAEQEPKHAAPERLRQGRQILAKLAQIKLRVAGHSNPALRRFIEAQQLEAVAALINGLNADAVAEAEKERSEEQDKAQRRRDHLLNLILAIGTALGLWLAWNQVEGLSLANFRESSNALMRASVGILLAFFFAVVFWIVSRRHSSDEPRD